MSDTRDTSAYPEGFPAILRRVERRRDPLVYAKGEALPPLDVDLAAMVSMVVLDPAKDPAESGESRLSYATKRRQLRREFIGKSELCYLNAMLIANLRKRQWPAQTPALFQRLWAEHGRFLINNLDARWLVSSITTFATAGINEPQRRTGQGMQLLFGMMKLYESERIHSGHAGHMAFDWSPKPRQSLAMEMDQYSIPRGDLDVNLLAPLWRDAEEDPVIQPLAHRLLTQLIEDPRTIFQRLNHMRQNHAQDLAAGALAQHHSASKPIIAQGAAQGGRFAIVTTTKRFTHKIKRFVEHHRAMGAAEIHIYFDRRARAARLYFADFPDVILHEPQQNARARRRRELLARLDMRKTFNAGRAYAITTADWLIQLDPDELLIAEDIRGALAARAPGDAVLALPVAELMPARERPDTESPKAPAPAAAQFRLPANGTPAQEALAALYPTFGNDISGALFGGPAHRAFVRSKIPGIRLGNGWVKQAGSLVQPNVIMENFWIARHHAETFDDFKKITKNIQNYPHYDQTGPTNYSLTDLIMLARQTMGRQGLRHFYHELIEARPEVIATLTRHGLLRSLPPKKDPA